MRIFIVCPTLNHGGAERLATLWASGFANQGKQVIVVANIGKDIAYSLPDNVELLPLSPNKNNKVLKYVMAIRMLRSYYKKYKPDVIIGVMYACSLIAKIAELGMHDGLTVLTKADAKVLNGRFRNVFVMPNPTFLTPLETVPNKENIVLAAGRLDAWEYKGFDVLIRAWGIIIQRLRSIVQREGWKLQIAGTGSKENFNYLKQLCKENGVEDSVELLGFQKDIETLYKRASIFVLSSRSEGLPMVLIESMSQGCAPIATDFKGRTKEVLDMTSTTSKKEGAQHIIEVGENGVTCNPEDADALATGIQRLMKDDDLRQSIQNHAVERSKYYALPNIISMWENLLKQIVHK